MMMKKLSLVFLMIIISNVKIYADNVACTSYIAFDAVGMTDSRPNNSNVYLADVNNIPNIIQISSFEEDTFRDWSPDGRQIAFNATYNRPNLFIYDVITKTTTAFLEGQDNFIFTFRWSPNGQKIAYVTANREYNSIQHLYLYDVVTQTTRNLTPTLDRHAIRIVWSPNSQIISLFVRMDPVYETQIIDIENIGMPPIRLENSVGFDWYPDGNRVILAVWDDEIPSYYTYNVETGETEYLSEDMGGFWSFNRQYIAYFGDEIYIRNTETDEIELLTSGFGDGAIKQVVWSPYSLEIAFFQVETDNIETRGGGYIYIKNMETGEVRNVLGANNPLYMEPLGALGWSPCIPPIE